MSDLRTLALAANVQLDWWEPADFHKVVGYDDAAYIAAASPAVVLALLDVVEAARELMQYEEHGAPDYIGWDSLFDALRAALAHVSEVMGE